MSNINPENAIEHTVDESPAAKHIKIDLKKMFYGSAGAVVGACMTMYYSYRLPEAGPKDGIMYVVESSCEITKGFGPDSTPEGKQFFREISTRNAIVRIGILQKEVSEEEVDDYIAAHVPDAVAVRDPGDIVDPNVEVTLVMISCSREGQASPTVPTDAMSN